MKAATDITKEFLFLVFLVCLCLPSGLSPFAAAEGNEWIALRAVAEGSRADW
jgi:hypothetical protein